MDVYEHERLSKLHVSTKTLDTFSLYHLLQKPEIADNYTKLISLESVLCM
jgi:hypothetical protein